jgi:hypothetical protein
MLPTLIEGVLAFVLISGLVAILLMEVRNTKRSSKKDKDKPESTLI